MSDGTNIEWTDATWNPLRGCSRVSEGCRNCYAETVAGRFAGHGQPYEGLAKLDAGGNRRWTGEVRLIESALLQSLRWTKPRRIFVNSMSDLFHEKVPDEWIDRIFAAMALAPQHTFQILTKRPQRMQEYIISRTKSLEVFTFKSSLADAARKISFAAGHFFPGNAPLMFFSNRDEDGNVPQGCVATPGWPLSHVWLGVSVEDQKTAD
ncbi:MAG: DUF5131 family protein, partial [Rhodospirillales bacterium]|nr:DUF5131 family protein [Rhodospirillales bacterium]